MTATPAPALFSLFTAIPENRDDLPLPTNGPYLLPSKNGYMVHRDFHWGRVLAPIKDAPIAEQKPYLWPEINLPAEIVGQAWSFFRAVWHARHSEAMVDITWSADKGYRLFCPPQKASTGGVEAKRNLEHYKGQIVGTIHSHCNFGAFHSGTDTHDADGHDGLHITLGKNDQDQPEQAIMVSVGGIRWDFEPKELWGETLPLVQHPKWWERQVKDPEPINAGKHVSSWRKDMGLTDTPKGAASQHTGLTVVAPPKTPTSIVASITTRQQGSEQRTLPTWANNFTSLDEMIWVMGQDMQQDDVDTLDAMNELVDLVSKSLNAMGFDFDYTIEEQRGPTPVQRSHADGFDHWFD